MPVEPWGRRYVIYQGKMYRSATLIIAFENPIIKGTIITWNWVERWYDECDNWYEVLCPSIEEYVRAWLAETYPPERYMRMQVKTTVTYECPYLPTKKTNKAVTTRNIYTVYLPLGMVAEILEAFTYTIVLEDVEGGRRGYRYPSLYLESLEVNVEEIARLVIAHHEDVFDRIKGYIHEKHSEMVTTKDPLLPNTLTSCDGRITDVEVNIEIEQVETVVEAEKDVEIEH